MSHNATNWAIRQRGLKPAAKIVLWHLADCHNAHTGQCNPRQSTLADMCEMSRSTINLHLASLEDRGLIRRHTEIDPQTRRQRPTHYTLALDDDEPRKKAVSENRTPTQNVDSATQDVVEPSPKTGHGAESEKPQKPSPKNEESRVRNSDSIENPGIEPGKEPCVSANGLDASFYLPGFVDRFLDAHPRPGDRDETEDQLRRAIESGVPPDHLLQAANAYRIEQKGNGRQYVAYSQNWLSREEWRKYQPKKPVEQSEIDAATVNLIRAGKDYLCRSITAVRARTLIDAGLVTEAECRQAGIRV